MICKSIETDATNSDVRHLYETAFPVEERIPWHDLMRLVDEIPLDFTIYYDDNENFIGFTIMMVSEPISWFWYFAVKQNIRNKGYGKKILDILATKYSGKTYFMDIESPNQNDCSNKEQRIRRTNFYLRNGFRMTEIHWYYEPIEYAILIKGNAAYTQQHFDNIKSELWSHWQP